eukprot:TRINITY_DN8924_c1_g1_i1.p10 TRINITY_DN8924_c1_g1~~TRINITY_DN8924_c1_g1_i1.p10  ORF type:complete len:102 (+),score=8.27 TRINITY_DN8924_c1_g1_i1:1626-1931(+)
MKPTGSLQQLLQGGQITEALIDLSSCQSHEAVENLLSNCRRTSIVSYLAYTLQLLYLIQKLEKQSLGNRILFSMTDFGKQALNQIVGESNRYSVLGLESKT